MLNKFLPWRNLLIAVADYCHGVTQDDKQIKRAFNALMKTPEAQRIYGTAMDRRHGNYGGPTDAPVS